MNNMSKIGEKMLDELKAIIKSPKLWITMAGVALIPTLYNVIFLSSMWDPYGNTKNLPVAVVNQDKSAKLNGKTISIGKDMEDNLSKNESLDFHFTTAKRAEKELEKGHYYMVITFPKDLSRKATTLMTEKPERLNITYKTTKGRSFVASKMSETAANKLKDEVAESITGTYTESVFKNMGSMKTGINKAADGSQELLNGSNKLQDGSQTLTSNLDVLASSSQTFSGGANKLNSGINLYTDGVGTLSNGLETLSDGVTAYTTGVHKLSEGSQKLDDKSQALVEGSEKLTDGLQQLSQATQLKPEQERTLQNLSDGLKNLNQIITNLQSTATTDSDTNSKLFNFLSTIESSTKALMNTAAADKQKQMTAVQSTSAFKSLTPEQQSQITSAVTGTPTSAETIAANISSNIENMKTVLSEASSSAPSNNGSQNLQTLSGTANNLVLKAISDLDKIQKLPTATKQLYQGSQTLTKGITDYTNAVGQLRKGAVTLDSKSNQLISGTQKASQGAQTLDSKSDQLRDGAGQLASGSDRIADGSNKLAGGGHQLTDGLTELSGGVSQLSSSLGKAGDQLSMVSVNKDNANAVSSPVTIKHEDYDSVDTNGVGMAPYMISVALMVVALSANVIFAKALSGKEPANRFSWAKNKLLINGFIATLAATILFFAVQFIGLKPDYPGKTYFIILLTAWTLMALVTALVGWDNRYGSFLSLLILLFQLGSSAGTYPIELSPKFFQTIQPFLPMTYSVSGLRETISLTGDVNHQWRMLVIFLVSSMILALLIYRKQED